MTHPTPEQAAAAHAAGQMLLDQLATTANAHIEARAASGMCSHCLNEAVLNAATTLMINSIVGLLPRDARAENADRLLATVRQGVAASLGLATPPGVTVQ